jgi:hypothetical protein
MSNPWHKEIYTKAIHEMAAHGEGKACDGWLNNFRIKYPEQYLKYADARAKIETLWGKTSPSAMETFKRAVRVEVEATKWALDRFNDGYRSGIDFELGECSEVVISWEERSALSV